MNYFQTFFYFSIALFVFSGCGPSADETLAKFDGGNVKRYEMRYLIQLDLGEDASQKANIEMQTSKLRQIALMKLGALAFKKAQKPLGEKEKKMANLRLLEAQQLTYTYQLKIHSNDFRINLHEFQFLSLNQSPDSPSRKEEASSYLKELNSGNLDRNQIEDYIQKKSEHGRYRWLGGYMDPVCIECNLNAGLHGISIKEMLKVVNKSDSSKFVLLHRPTNVLIFRKINSQDIALEDLEDYLKKYFRKTMKLSQHYAAHANRRNKPAAAAASMAKSEEQLELSTHQLSERQRNEIKKQITRIKMEQLRQKHHFEWKLSSPKTLLNLDSNTTDDSTTIFTLEGKNYTLENLKKDLLYLGLENEDKTNLFSIINGIIVPRSILAYDATFVDCKDTEEFKFFNSIVNLRIKNQAYFSNLPMKKPTQSEVRKYYQQSIRNKPGKKPSFAKIKNKISTYLAKQKRMSLIKEQQRTISQEYNLKILSKHLITNEI